MILSGYEGMIECISLLRLMRVETLNSQRDYSEHRRCISRKRLMRVETVLEVVRG